MKSVRITLLSMKHRKTSVILTFLTLMVSCVLLLGVVKLQTSVKSHFERSISGIDLIVGPAAGPVNLLLYGVFRIGDPLANIDYSLYKELSQDPQVSSVVPLSMGDNHRGYRVLATTAGYFEHYRLGGQNSRSGDGEDEKLYFTQGDAREFSTRLDAVILGYEVAKELGYELGKKITISHGVDKVSFEEHTNFLFEVVGILAPTATAVDRSLHISLEGLEAVHAGWNNTDSASELQSNTDHSSMMDALEPSQVTVLLVSLKSKLRVFQLQRRINSYARYQAILPGVAFQQFWQIIEVCESLLKLISLLVLLCTLTGMICAMVNTLVFRRREMAIFRALGGSAKYVSWLFLQEAMILVVAAMVAAYALSILALMVLGDYLVSIWGIYLDPGILYGMEWWVMGVVLGLGALAGLVPAMMAYKSSVRESLTMA